MLNGMHLGTRCCGGVLVDRNAGSWLSGPQWLRNGKRNRDDFPEGSFGLKNSLSATRICLNEVPEFIVVF